jgi:hypothetical protein
MSAELDLPYASDEKRWALPVSILLALLFVGALQLLTIDVGLHMADEGFLWYGVQRVVAGDVPLRDFQAYDPGRYYWCALLAGPLGPSGAGVVAVRWAVALFGAVGLVLALLVAARFVRSPLHLVPCALVLALWMFPRHKLFEPALLAATLWVGVRLVERPSLGRHVAAGLLAGAAGFVGRNLALYATVGLGLLALHLALHTRASRRWKPLVAFAAAVPAGYAPVLGMIAFVPGFGAAFVRSIELQARHGANLPLPYPWPWRTDWSALDGWLLWGNVALAAFFLLPWVVLPLGLAQLVRARGPSSRAVPVAAGVIGLVALHHVSVRSDAPHLAQCSWPILLLALELSSRWSRPVAHHAAWALLASASLLAALVSNTQLSRFRPDVQRTLVDHPVAGDVLRLSAGQDRELRRIERLFAEHVPADARVWIVNRPTLYPLLGRVAPLWWLHLYFEATEEEQRELIRELDARGVDWVLIVSEGEEGLEERLFPETHALVWQHLLDSFDRLADDALPAGHYFFRRRA